MIKKLIALCFIIVILLACNLTDLAGEYGNVQSVSPSDEEMNAAIQRAKETLSLFVVELQNPKPTQSYFSIKARIPYGDSGAAEHLWVDHVSYNHAQFTGILANEPVYVEGYHLGDTIVVESKNVSDWMIIENNQVYGGFTLYVLMEYMTEAEKADFLSESGFYFGDEPLLP